MTAPDHSMHPLELYGPGDELLAKLREVCLGFPEGVEAGGVGAPSFKVRDKIYAMQHKMGAASGHANGRPSLWVKGLPGAQELLVGSDPARFFRPPYVGHRGWVGAYLDPDDVDWGHLRALVEESYRMTAPKRLVAQLDGQR